MSVGPKHTGCFLGSIGHARRGCRKNTGRVGVDSCQCAGASALGLVAQAWRSFERAVPMRCRVSPAVPILFFGDLDAYCGSQTLILTVGLNPSLEEFPSRRPFRRFPLASTVTPSDPERYIRALSAYFGTDPYDTWFPELRADTQRSEGELLPTMGFDRAPHRYLLTRRDRSDLEQTRGLRPGGPRGRRRRTLVRAGRGVETTHRCALGRSTLPLPYRVRPAQPMETPAPIRVQGQRRSPLPALRSTCTLVPHRRPTRRSSFGSEDSADGEFPPRIVHDGKTFFLIAIDIGTDREAASKETRADRTVISRADLTVQDGGE